MESIVMFLHWWCLCTCCVSHSTLLTQLKPETSSFAFVCHELDHKRQFFHAHFFQFIILITYSVGKSPKKSHFAIWRSEREFSRQNEMGIVKCEIQKLMRIRFLGYFHTAWNSPIFFGIFVDEWFFPYYFSLVRRSIFSHVSIAKSIGQQLLLKSVPDFWWWKGR